MAKLTYEQAVAYIDRAGRSSIDDIDSDLFEEALQVVEQRADAVRAEIFALGAEGREPPQDLQDQAKKLADVVKRAAAVAEKLPEGSWLETGPMSHLTKWKFEDLIEGFVGLSEDERTAEEIDPSQKRRQPGGGRGAGGQVDDDGDVFADSLRGQLAEAAIYYRIPNAEYRQIAGELNRILKPERFEDGSIILPPDPGVAEDLVANQVALWAGENVPIGVPQGFNAVRSEEIPVSEGLERFRQERGIASGTRPRTVAPRYYQGDEWSLAGLSPEQVSEWQRKLVDAGLIDPDSFYPGVWTDVEATALKTVLGVANASGATLDNTLAEMIANPPQWLVDERAEAKVARTFQAPPYLKPDYAALAEGAKSQARNRLGREPTAEEMAELTSFMSGVYRQGYEAEVAALRADFEANVALEETGVAQTPATVQDIDEEARFRRFFDQRFGPELDFIEDQEQTARHHDNVMASLSTMGNLIG